MRNRLEAFQLPEGNFDQQIVERNDLDFFEQEHEVPVGLSKQYRKKLIKKRIGKSTRSCVFCFEKFQKNEIVRFFPCKHYFHVHCLKTWFEANTTCPICRFDVKKFFSDEEQEEV